MVMKVDLEFSSKERIRAPLCTELALQFFARIRWYIGCVRAQWNEYHVRVIRTTFFRLFRRVRLTHP
jgi:hypothetical protein